MGVSTIQMVRALVTSAAGDDRRARDARGEALVPCILAYARQHLSERDLTPARIAQVHNISVRHLYTVCAAANVCIAEWIIEQRLAGARQDLLDQRYRLREASKRRLAGGDSSTSPTSGGAFDLPTAYRRAN
jgi:AraC-like DNA-binding protein